MRTGTTPLTSAGGKAVYRIDTDRHCPNISANSNLYSCCVKPIRTFRYSLYGLQTIYVSTTRAVSEVATVRIDKPTIARELFKYEIFRLNYQNVISGRAQSLQRRLWQAPAGSLRNRFIHFLLMHFERPTGRKVVKIKMEDLAQILNETRLNVSRVLNQMQDEGLLSLHRGGIEIPEASLLA